MALFEAYTLLMDSDWSGLNITGQDLSGRDISRVDLSEGNFSGTNFAQSNLSESIFVTTDLSYANFRGANLQNTVLVNFMGGSLEGTDFTDANLEGAFGLFDLSGAILTNATCPDGSLADETSCISGPSEIPPPLGESLFFADTTVRIITTPYTTEMYYMGVHEYIPGVITATASGASSSVNPPGERWWAMMKPTTSPQQHGSWMWEASKGSNSRRWARSFPPMLVFQASRIGRAPTKTLSATVD